MPQDSDEKPAVAVGRTYPGEYVSTITTPEAVADLQARRTAYASKQGAVSIQVYFVAKGISSPILQASMLAYTDIRAAPVEDFDRIFGPHDAVSIGAIGTNEESK